MQIIDVIKADRLEDFLKLPKQIYANDPYYRPGNHGQEIQVLLQKNPNTRVLLIADKARMVLIPTPEFGMIGYFDAHNDQTAVDTLFDAAFKYFKSLGLHRVIGPMNGDTWHSYRLNCGPYTEPFLFEPYNPEYYPKLWQQSGFDVIAEYYSKRIDDIASMIPLLEPKYQRAIDQGFQFRIFDATQFDAELNTLYDISCKAFVDNFLYTEISFEDFYALYKPAEKMLIPILIVIVTDSTGKALGYLFGMPNSKDTFNGKTIAVLPEYRQYGLGSALQHQVYKNALALGFTKSNLCLIHQGNPSGRINKESGDIIRTYNLYERNIDEL